MGACRGGVLVVAMATAVPTAAGELDLLPLGDPDRAYVLESVAAASFVDTRSGDRLDLEQVADHLVGARVVLVGEEHTAMDQKRFQADLLRALAARTDALVLGMEFFRRTDDEALARWSRGEIDDEALLREVGWYDRGSMRYEASRPVMDAARELGVPVVGLNVDRSIVRAVNRGGLDSLDEDQRQEVGEIRVEGSPQHRYLIGRYFGETVAMLPPEWYDNMYAAQCVWDVVMARSILAGLPDDATMMVVVGSGHVAYDLGISRRIREERAARAEPPLEVATFVPVTAPPPAAADEPDGHPMGGHGHQAAAEPQARFVRSLADVVGGFAATGGLEPWPSLGLRLTESDSGEPTVQMVWPDTPAAAAGFARGDVILDLDGRVPVDASHLRRMLATLEWGDRVGLTVRRDGDDLEIGVVLAPELVTVAREVVPGWEVTPAVAVDPSSPAAMSPVPQPEGPSARLVSREGRALRLEVWAGDRLDELHELDDASRVSRSLYRQARPDGAIEVLWTRDATGEVVRATRLDRFGTVID